MDNSENTVTIPDKGNWFQRYDLVNNAAGWLCFVIAALTYLLSIEPTASFWDCPEFIAQGAKLEVGHPPGNPIFMLTARFFVTIFGGSMQHAALAINCMSALLSAATILLLFWTVTHLVRRLIIRDDATEISLPKLMVIMGAGVCGALAYAWSDTFWFSAVESEVYAFSSFCTALVFWLILKWENRADNSQSDRYLILIAYVIGVSIAVHLLNLLCIPAIVLVIYYRKFKNVNVKGSLIALLISFAIVGAILFGLIPGFMKVAQWVDLFSVNTLGMPYNIGVLIYVVVFMIVMAFAIYALYNHLDKNVIKGAVTLSVIMSGLPFITAIPSIWILLILAVCTSIFMLKIQYRVYNVLVMSLFVIFVGYSSYALLLIRASANTPMNQNAPDNVFTLASYLNREQYGKTPLIYGQVFAQGPSIIPVGYAETGGYLYGVRADRSGRPVVSNKDGYKRDENYSVLDYGEKTYTKVAKTNPSVPDHYEKAVWTDDLQKEPAFNMLFTRMYSSNDEHIKGYKSWGLIENEDLENWKNIPENKRLEWAQQGYIPIHELYRYAPNLVKYPTFYNSDGTPLPDAISSAAWKPSFMDNLRYFLNYQLVHMYWRYFMWNFAGRQNDIQGNGEPHLGNWITGYPLLDNLRLGDQSLLPEQYTTGNKGHNVYYMLPLLLGLLGLIWQALVPHRSNPDRGIEQFWVVFFLFFMTGIAIVLYLNQPPGQPRERDYAFAGSFYAFAIWIGLGVPAIWSIAKSLMAKKKAKSGSAAGSSSKDSLICACIACTLGVVVPLQMVSQTWDDHDRSHRYTTRDFGANYLESLEENAVIFTNGDNDTFPLWYAQEVEGIRTDVRVVNLSYLSTDWYANQLRHPYYDADAVKMTASPYDYAYDKLQVVYTDPDNMNWSEAMQELRDFYDNPMQEIHDGGKAVAYFSNPSMYIEVDSAKVFDKFGVDSLSTEARSFSPVMMLDGLRSQNGGFTLNTLLSFDIMANSIYDNFERPVYFATTVPSMYYLNMRPYLYQTGMAYMVTPFYNSDVSPLADEAYKNIVSKFKWGGLDDPKHNDGLYLDETVRRMVSSTRSSIISTASELIIEGSRPASEFAVTWAKENGLPVPANRYDMGRYLLNLMEEKMPGNVAPYEGLESYLIPEYLKLYRYTGNPEDLARAEKLIDEYTPVYAKFMDYALSLSPVQFNALNNDATYARINLPNMLAYRNYIDLLKAINKIDDAEERAQQLAYLDAYMHIDDIYSQTIDINPGVYMHGITFDEALDGYNTYSGREKEKCQMILGILHLNADNGIDPMARTKELFSGLKCNPDGISRLDVYLPNY